MRWSWRYTTPSPILALSLALVRALALALDLALDLALILTLTLTLTLSLTRYTTPRSQQPPWPRSPTLLPIRLQAGCAS